MAFFRGEINMVYLATNFNNLNLFFQLASIGALAKRR